MEKGEVWFVGKGGGAWERAWWTLDWRKKGWSLYLIKRLFSMA